MGELGLSTLLTPLAQEIAAQVVSALRPVLLEEVRRAVASVAPSSPEFADAKNNPLGSARAFLDAGRRGDFRTFKRGRTVVARWGDVVAYIESRGVNRCGAKANDVDPSALFADMMKGKGSRRRGTSERAA